MVLLSFFVFKTKPIWKLQTILVLQKIIVYRLKITKNIELLFCDTLCGLFGIAGLAIFKLLKLQSLPGVSKISFYYV